MNCVTQNTVACDNIRSITINRINLDNTKTTVILYFDVATGESISTRDAQQCPNIEAFDFNCAEICTI